MNMECTRMLALVLFVYLLVLVQSQVAQEAVKVQYCGKKLSQVLAKICRRFRTWEDYPAYSLTDSKTPPTAGSELNRIRRHDVDGIADECCSIGCSPDQLTSYCAPGEQIDGSTSFLDASHYIADRSVEAAAPEPETNYQSGTAFKKLFGASEVRRSKCGCRRRKRRAGRRQGSGLTGKMTETSYALRSAPIVGTVSPLLSWGRTLQSEVGYSDQLAYVTV